MTERPCVVDGCAKLARRTGRMCSMHEARLRRTGMTDARPIETREDRYWLAVRKAPTGCWGWAGSVNNHGYGKVGQHYAHRFSWQLHFGPIPVGLYVMHVCDNPPCTNPSHLQLGTQKANMEDASRKGRLRSRPPRGEANHFAKLTAQQALEIRRRRLAGEPRKVIAASFGIRVEHVGRIALGHAWSGV